MAGDGGVKAVLTAVIGNSTVTVAKFGGWVMTGSPSLMAEAIHSAADTGNQLMLYVGIKKSEKAATREAPDGHGRRASAPTRGGSLPRTSAAR